ncbi:HEPN domain-containing protein [Singulisphaera acidiphila]|uniref:HEPN domain-containing protein n=1 Tax=Singulisphaera acidiphila (strain ATCC BAA-1392 / DSM 18658 / VKM B-2454 / MOB10) TaxID=886293 RepID=L0DPW4_SINAD|nr:HEPN domain-containing protein [Singulisphaera acidiphila]AGA31404.1 HEPN domain-containing protein [Singulisphaera acidiphila DSM 18658]
MVNQEDLQQMTEERIKDAKVLIRGKRWEFAYYTAGYAVECALKSCLLARMVQTGWVFDEKNKNVEACRVHELIKLIDIAGLRNELNKRLETSASVGDRFVTHWAVVSEWKVTSRYDAKTEIDAKKLVAAITDKPDGVLRWIQNYW